MRNLQKGQFFGQTNQTDYLSGITLTDTVYTQPKVDWHYHENAYFTFILEGKVVEGNKKEVYNCDAGSLLYHNWQDPHYNIKPDVFTRGFHMELENAWFDQFSFDVSKVEGSIKISNPNIKLILYKIFKESKINDESSVLNIQSLVLQALDQLYSDCNTNRKNSAEWVAKIKEILHDDLSKSHTLDGLVKELKIHPVHLSRDFPKHFQCTLGDYIRKLKINKSFTLLINKKLSLTEISYICGFADQSHFGRCFRKQTGLSPLAYRKMLLT